MTTITALAASFRRSQKAEGRSPHTIHLYHQCIARLVPFALQQAGTEDIAAITRRLLTDFYGSRVETVAASTVWTDWKVHRVFLQWCVDEDELPEHPMARMKPPKQPSRPVRILTDEDISCLLRACEGKTRRDKRDMAMIRLALGSGARRGELAGLTLGDVDLEDGLVRVTGKGKTGIAPIGSRTVIALDRHINASQPTDSEGFADEGRCVGVRPM